MQPEPARYLLGARRALLKIIDRGQVKDITSVMTLDRAAETLAQLALREAVLPGILAPALDVQTQILSDAIVLAREIPGTDPHLGAATGAPPADVIDAYEQQGWRLSQAFRVLAMAPGLSPDLAARRDTIARRALALESDVRVKYLAGLEGLKADDLARPQTDDDALRAPPSAEQLTTYLRRRLPDSPDLVVREVEQLIAFNSKDIIFLKVEGAKGWPTSLVLRRMRSFSVNEETSVRYEFDLLDGLHQAGVLVPKPLLVDEAGGDFGEPFLIMERAPGIQEKSATLGANAQAVGADMGRVLAKIHAVDPAISKRPELRLAPQARVLERLEMFYRIWRDNQAIPSIALEAAFAWARANVGVLGDAAALVHGDFDLRNLLVDGDHVSAVLDWERSHIGHPAEDFAYCRPDLAAAGGWDAFRASYRRHGGIEITDAMLDYFEVWRCLFHSASGGRAHNGYLTGLHDDFIMGSVGHMEFANMLERLRTLLLAK